MVDLFLLREHQMARISPLSHWRCQLPRGRLHHRDHQLLVMSLGAYKTVDDTLVVHSLVISVRRGINMAEAQGERSGFGLQFTSIQILRAVAATTVFLAHLGGMVSTKIDPSGQNIFAAGYLGVDLFFVISGFIICFATDRDLTVKTFAAKRIARVVPLYWLLTFGVMSIAIFMPYLLQGTKADFIGFVMSLVFIPHARHDGLIAPTLSLGWTINYEMFFYTLFALSLIFGRLRVFVSICIIVTVVIFGKFYDGDLVYIKFWSDPIIIEFSFGCIVFLFYKYKPHIIRSVRFLWLPAAIILAAQNFVDFPVSRIIKGGIPAAVLILSLLDWQPTRSWLTRAAVVVGDASYSMYLVHMYVIQAIVFLIVPRIPFGPDGRVVTVYCLSIPIVVVVSILLFRYFEVPMNRLLQGKLIKGGPSV